MFRSDWTPVLAVLSPEQGIFNIYWQHAVVSSSYNDRQISLIDFQHCLKL